MQTSQILSVEERVSAVCQLINEGKSVAEICEMVEHEYCNDSVFKSFISGVRHGKIRPDISSTYGLPKADLVSIRANAKIELTIKEEITKLYRQGTSAARTLQIISSKFPLESDEYYADLIRRAYRTLTHQIKYSGNKPKSASKKMF